MAYYISLNVGQQPIFSQDNETSSGPPTADIICTIGGGNAPVAGMSRDTICQILDSFKNYIRSDDPHNGGGNTLSLLVP